MEPRSSPSRVSGVVIREIQIADRTFTLSQPDKVRKAADEEAFVLSRRLDMLGPIMDSCARLPEESRQAALQQYMKTMTNGIASMEEWDAYYNSLWKLAFDLWCALDPKEKLDPEDRQGKRQRTLLDGVRWCYELINGTDVTVDQHKSLRMAIRIVSQRDQVGNSSGPSSPPDSPATDILSTAVTS